MLLALKSSSTESVYWSVRSCSCFGDRTPPHPSHLNYHLIPHISTTTSSLTSQPPPHPSHLNHHLIPHISTTTSSLTSQLPPHPSHLNHHLIPHISTTTSSLTSQLPPHPSHLNHHLIPHISTTTSSLTSQLPPHPSHLNHHLIPHISTNEYRPIYMLFQPMHCIFGGVIHTAQVSNGLLPCLADVRLRLLGVSLCKLYKALPELLGHSARARKIGRLTFCGPGLQTNKGQSAHFGSGTLTTLFSSTGFRLKLVLLKLCTTASTLYEG